MLQSPLFRLVVLLLATSSLLMTLAAVHLFERGRDEGVHKAQAEQVADLLRLQRAAQMIFDAQISSVDHSERAQQGMREVAAIWRRHQNWSLEPEYAALKARVAEFEQATQAAPAEPAARMPIAQSLNHLLGAINTEIAAVLERALLHEKLQNERKQQRQLSFLLFAASAVILPLWIAAWFGRNLALRLRRISEALADPAPAGGDVFARLAYSAQTMNAARFDVQDALQETRLQVQTQAVELAQLHATQELQQARFQALEHICAEGLWEWEITNDLVRFSSVWSRMLAYPEAAAPQRIGDWLKLIHPEDRPQAEAARMGFVSGNLNEFEMDLRLRHADGGWRHMRVRCFCSRMGDRAILFGSHVDRTVEQGLWSEQQALHGRLDATHAELVQTRERMLRAAQLAALGRISSGISDEISTPMGIVLTAASSLDDESRQLMAVLRSGPIRRGDLDRYLRLAGDASQLILKHAERAADLARSFRHVATDQVSEEKRQFFIEAYFTEILLTLAPQFKKTPHCFLFDCVDNPEIDSYPGVFTQIFTHLISNALQHAFSPDQPGVLAIRVRCYGENELELVFSDNGCGIPDELHEKVFEPFHPGRRGLNHGGLGLAMTRKLVEERLSGHVWIENTPGGGATVMIRIPVDSNRSKA